MLLSMVISFLLARRFSGKKYVLLMTILLVLVAFLSVLTIPLSFPFYVASYIEVTGGQVIDNMTMMNAFQPYYDIVFLTLKIEGFEPGTIQHIDLVLVYSFFVLVNLLGAILGFWIKTRRR